MPRKFPLKKNDQPLTVAEKWSLESGLQGEPTQADLDEDEAWRQRLFARQARGEDVTKWPGSENIVMIESDSGEKDKSAESK